MTQGGKALVVIDVQNDYFPDGLFPLWNAEACLNAVVEAIHRAKKLSIPIVFVQHIADAKAGPAPFFNQGTHGADLHPKLVAAAPNSTVVVKTYADSFVGTNLEEVLSMYGVKHILVCGMMTQNCVTHTAISKSAEKYEASILLDCCTTVSEILHKIALHAVSTRVSLTDLEDALPIN